MKGTRPRAALWIKASPLILVIVACGGGIALAAAAPAQGEVVLKMAHGVSTSDPFHVAASKLAELVAAKTSGKVKVEVFPGGQLGNDRQMIEGMKMGTLDMSIQGNSNYEAFMPSISIFDLPFLFRDRPHAYKVLDGPIAQEVYKELLDKQGLRVLAVAENGFRQTTTGKKPINSLADVKGLKMRVPPTRMFLDTWKALGANPTAIEFVELFTALQQGVVDGQENALGLMAANKFYEVQKYLAMTNHMYSATYLTIAERAYKSLSPEGQKAITEAAAEARDFQRQFVISKDDENLAKLKAAGMIVTYPDRGEFIKAVQPVIDEFKAKFGADRVNRIVSGG